MVIYGAFRGYVEALLPAFRVTDIDARALAWAGERGSRSGRTAWQFVQSLGIVAPSDD